MRSVKVSGILVNDTSVFLVRSPIDGNLIALFRHDSEFQPIVLCHRQGESSVRGDDFSPVRRGVLLVASALSLVDERNRTSLIGVFKRIGCFCLVCPSITIAATVTTILLYLTQVGIQRRKIVDVAKRCLRHLPKNAAIVWESWIVDCHKSFSWVAHVPTDKTPLGHYVINYQGVLTPFLQEFASENQKLLQLRSRPLLTALRMLPIGIPVGHTGGLMRIGRKAKVQICSTQVTLTFSKFVSTGVWVNTRLYYDTLNGIISKGGIGDDAPYEPLYGKCLTLARHIQVTLRVIKQSVQRMTDRP